MSAKTRRVLIGAAVAAAAIGAASYAMVPAERFVYGVAPIAAGEAVLLTRRNEDRDTFFWAQLVRRDGTVVWTSDTEGFATEEALGFSGVVASEDRVVLLGNRVGNTAIMALDRASGARRWEVEIAAGESDFIGPMLIADGPRVYAVHDYRNDGVISALALHDGAVQWRFEISAHFKEPTLPRVELLAPDRLAVAPMLGRPGVLVDGATGTVLGPLPMHWIGCATPDALIGFADNTVVRLPRSAGLEAQRMALGATDRSALDGPCGERDGDVIVGAEGDDRRGAVVRFDPRTGAVRWRLALGPGIFTDSETADGRLPRFLPVMRFGGEPDSAASRTRTYVVDLDRGEIVSEHVHDEHRMVFATAERAFAVGLFGGTVFAFDPSSGALARANRFTNADIREVRTQDYRFGELWVTSHGWGRPGALGWAVLDLENGNVVAESGDVVATDVTAAGW